MSVIALTILAGIGQFFIGMKLLSAHLKEVASENLRRNIQRIIGHRWLTALLGLGAGILTQSTNAVTAAATGLSTANIISIRQALPLIAGANIGTSLLVFLVSFNLNHIMLFGLALCGVFYFSGLDQSKRWRGPVNAFFALILIMLGLDLVTSAAKELRHYPELQQIIGWASNSPITSFVIGALLTPVLQTAKTVAAIVAAMAEGGMVMPLDAMMMVIGANMTSAVNTIWISSGVSVTGRILALYQSALKIIGSLLALPLVLALPWLAPDATSAFYGLNAALAVAVAYLWMQLSAYLVSIVFEGWLIAFLERKAKRTIDEEQFTPRFISPDALREPATGATLAFYEHLDSLSMLPAHFGGVREGGEGADIARRLSKRARIIMGITDQFLAELSNNAQDPGLRQKIGSLQRLSGLGSELQEQIATLADLARPRSGRDDAIEMRLASFVESAHLTLESFIDFTREPDALGRETLVALTSNRADVIDGIRRAVMSGESQDTVGHKELFDACLCFERAIWLINRYVMISDEKGSPYRAEGEGA